MYCVTLYPTAANPLYSEEYFDEAHFTNEVLADQYRKLLAEDPLWDCSTVTFTPD